MLWGRSARVAPEDLSDAERQKDLFVERFLGLERRNNEYQKSSQIIILDLNEAADEVVEVASAVMARLVFDRLRGAEPRNRLPINLVLEEAQGNVGSNIPLSIARKKRTLKKSLPASSERLIKLATQNQTR
jgi:hypothetical protein